MIEYGFQNELYLETKERQNKAKTQTVNNNSLHWYM